MARRIMAAALVLVVAASGAAAQTERRIVAAGDTDRFGHDIRTLAGVEHEACYTACLRTEACRAYTYNTAARACFLKSEAGAASPYPGAISGRIIESPAPDPARRARLSFLPDARLVEADGVVAVLGARSRADGQSPDALRAAAAARLAAGDTAGAAVALAAAAALADDPADWTALARTLAESVDPTLYQSRPMLDDAASAAIRAVLLAPDGEPLATAYDALGAVLGPLGAGRAALDAARRAQAAAPSPARDAALDAATARWGFRVTGHRVESDAASPRICLDLSEPLPRLGVNLADFVRVEGLDLPVEAEERAACVEGVEHGRRYRITVRAGLPSAAGEALRRPVSLEAYVRDRSPAVRFSGRAHVLPKAGPASIPLVSVNAGRVALRIHRIGERNLLRAIQDGLFAGTLDGWREGRIAGQLGAPVWEGETEVSGTLNRETTTALPLGEAIARFEPGAYVMTARIPGASEPWEDAATQWFVVTDLGLATLGAADGLHVFVRSLASAGPVAGAAVTLLSAANEILGTAETDAEGRARFAPGLLRGAGGMAAALVTVALGDDLAFLDIARPGFDLSDRGVEGRPAPGPVDVFLSAERGVWRPGETVHATILARDAAGAAIPGLPLTAVLLRPDGVEHARAVLPDMGAGGRTWAQTLPAGAQRGPWRLAVHADPQAPALAETTVRVEDFLPERLALDLALPPGPLDLSARIEAALSARWLYGAPGAGLGTEIESRLAPVRELPGWPGFRFGLDDEPATPVLALAGGPETGPDGAARLPLPRPAAAPGTRPLALTVLARVADPSGRVVERAETRAIAPAGLLLGLRPLFAGDLPEGAEAAFEAVAVGPDLAATEAGPVEWTLSRIETRYQWHGFGGRWQHEAFETRTREASGRATLGAGGPVRIAVPVRWGRYELRLTRTGPVPSAASVVFSAGWWGGDTAPDAPDRLAVGLDRPTYRPGDTARLRIAARSAGQALVAVVDTRLIAVRTVPVGPGETVVELPVTDDWGAGAYVVATMIRPMDGPATREPVRALGLAWAAVDPGPRRLAAAFEVPETAPPRAPFDVRLRIPGLAPGERAHATIAAVDLGILSLTGFAPPAPDDWAFGQRRLGARLHDLYGALIDAGQGEPGRLRSGGDGGLPLAGAAPQGTTVALFSGLVEADAEGGVAARFAMPDFNGTVRLMAVAWTEAGLGHAVADVAVRDPVVATLSGPRFLSPGDTAEAVLELAHVEGPSGPVAAAATGEGALVGAAGSLSAVLEPGGRLRLPLPVQAGAAGDGALRVRLDLPGGAALDKAVAIPVRALDPPQTRSRPLLLAPGETVRIGPETAAGLRPGTVTATVTAGALALVDAAGVMAALDRYPFGCTEQLVSQAMPLLAAAPLAEALGLAADAPVGERIGQAVAGVLANQSGTGGFGLWQPGAGDLWLDAYVTDFLTRARAAGHAVPATALAAALDNLRARAGYESEFEHGGEGLAHALYVLAREGQASIADLRYYADARAEAFATPLALAQLGAALAAYGEQHRADALFRRAVDVLGRGEAEGWRDDYGTARRDAAGLAALAAEARTDVVDRAGLLAGLGADGPLSTQEMAWMLRAAAAIAEADAATVAFDGAAADGPALRRLDPGATLAVTNRGAAPLPVTVTASGVPEVPPAAGGQGYAVARQYFALDGTPVDPSAVAQGTRLVTVLTVRADAPRAGRLMLVDPLPAGFEIDNPSLLRSGEVSALGWLDAGDPPAHVAFRDDRLEAALDWREHTVWRVAYMVRAVTPGRFHHAAPSVEDMYRPAFRAVGAAGTVTVTAAR